MSPKPCSQEELFEKKVPFFSKGIKVEDKGDEGVIEISPNPIGSEMEVIQWMKSQS